MFLRLLATATLALAVVAPAAPRSDWRLVWHDEFDGATLDVTKWVREAGGRRVFYTSLGHADDFKDASFTRLLVNALAWTTKTELTPTK